MKFDIKPPKVKKEIIKLEKHGHIRNDPYFWMNQRDSEEVLEHLKAENEYCNNVMKDILPFSNKLFDEIKGRIPPEDDGVPYKKGNYFYYHRFLKDKEYPVYYRKKDNMDNPEELLCDINEMAKDHEYYNAYIQPSENNELFALIYDNVGRFQYNIRVCDIEKKEWIDIQLDNLSGDIEWAKDNETILLTQKDPVSLRSYRVLSYNIKTGESNTLYEEKDESFSVYVYKSACRNFIFINSDSTISSENYYIYADKPDKIFLFSERERDILYSIDSINNKFFIQTSRNKKNFEVFTADFNDTRRIAWKPFIPFRKEVDIEDMVCFTEFIVIAEREDGLINLRILSYDKKTDHKIQFNLETYSVYTIDSNEAESNTLRYTIQSLNTPPEVWDYDLKQNTKTLLKRKVVIGGFNPDEYKLERLHITAEDNTKIPVSLAYRKDKFKKGNNPLLIEGYGSYGYPEDPWFNYSILSLMDRGFVYAIAHIRGGGDLGRDWYEDGKLLKKKNTFHDFIDSTIALINEGYGHKDKVFAKGGSAGGLLMGAIANIKGELYKGIISTVPFVDVITTMLDDSIPLTTGEYDEWGNPNNKEYYDYMLSYSPYDNVKAQSYPHIFTLTGYHDSQVQYWEPAKWTAKLRDYNTSDSLILFDCDMDSGHSGPSGRFSHIKRTAKIYAFMLDLMDIRE